MSLEGKVAVVTGGGSGIGRASALKLAAAGVAVCVSDINLENGNETAQMIEEAGGNAIFKECNVAQDASVKAMVDAALETFGGLDIGVNNAGVGGMMAPTDQINEAAFDLVMDVNVKGVWLCMKYEIPAILARGGGSIINVASLAGLVGFRANAAYAASKHAVIGLTKSAALEYARKGLRVNAVCPGFTETPMVQEMLNDVPTLGDVVQRSSPMRRLGRVEEIADAILYLASDGSSFINGHAMALDGGASAQ
jgi:NAD(P)-dependent dehydrogenase (short-subunit alcohol dehydrogenase family)